MVNILTFLSSGRWKLDPIAKRCLLRRSFRRCIRVFPSGAVKANKKYSIAFPLAHYISIQSKNLTRRQNDKFNRHTCQAFGMYQLSGNSHFLFPTNPTLTFFKQQINMTVLANQQLAVFPLKKKFILFFWKHQLLMHKWNHD